MNLDTSNPSQTLVTILLYCQCAFLSELKLILHLPQHCKLSDLLLSVCREDLAISEAII